MMKQKMPWLKDRLRTLNQTPTRLAHHLNIAAPRVYEMIGGRRAMQPDEIEPTATFLKWTVPELLARLPKEARVLPVNDRKTTSDRAEVIPRTNPQLTSTKTTSLIPILATVPPFTENFDCLLTGETTRYIETVPALKGRNDIQCLYLSNTTMQPWRDQGDLVAFEKEKPPRPGIDYVVIYLIDKTVRPQHQRVLVRRLLESKHAGKVRVRQYNPSRDTEIDAQTIASMFRVLSWEDVLR